MKQPLLAAIVLSFALLVAACGGGDGQGGGEVTEEAPATEEAAGDRCENVPKALVSGIETGLTVQGGGTLKNAQAVKSEDFENVYFISAEIDGPGMEGSGEVGTWASNSLTVGEGLISPSMDSPRSFPTGAMEARRTPN